MDGELLLTGYKFKEKLSLNLQSKTILTGDDTFTIHEIFNMIDNYFNRQAFSDFYLDTGVVMVLNGNILRADEFAVFRLSPIIDLSGELKVSKKSILGQVIRVLFDHSSDELQHVEQTLERKVLSKINTITSEYGVSFSFEADDIFNLAKILQPIVTEKSGHQVLINEHDQYQCKTFLIDLIGQIQIKKKKLLLVELPEYGLREAEVPQILNMLAQSPIDNVIIYTRRLEMAIAVPSIFNYHLSRDYKILGFDDYDELDKELKELLIDCSTKEIELKVIGYILGYGNSNMEEDVVKVIEKFLG